jgi:hypothetical protein
MGESLFSKGSENVSVDKTEDDDAVEEQWTLAPPTFSVDPADTEALYHSQQVFTVTANPDAADAEQFNAWQEGLSE